MSEHDIAKHTKEIYKAVTNHEKKWKHRVIDILIEIGIIVFAITLSLFVERWREHLHEKKIEKEFLTGLKKDLRNDLAQLKDDSLAFVLVRDGWNYFRTVGINDGTLNTDSVAKYNNSLFGYSDFLPNDSRFEALKSSGELGTIEDDSLQNLILDLYQNKIKSMKLASTFFSNFHNTQMVPFLADNLRLDKNKAENFTDILKMPRMQNYLSLGNTAVEIVGRYHLVMAQSRQIIDMINKQYDLKE